MSPKNKGTFGKGKTAVEPDDEFLSTMSRVGRALEPYVKKIVLGVVIITALLVVVFAWRHYNTVKEESATSVYAEAATLAAVPVLPPRAEDSLVDTADGKPPATPDAVPEVFVPKDENNDSIPDSFPSSAERAKPVIDDLDKLDAKYGGTDVAKSSRLLRAGMLYDLGQYQAAYDTFRKFASSSAPRPLKDIAREGMGHASEALAMSTDDPGQRTAALQQALESYRSIQTEAKQPNWDRSLYHSARIQAELGQAEEARKTLRQALEDMPEGDMEAPIKQYLAQLEASGK
jgi:tetratricopeptide (TPR) repeat protein